MATDPALLAAITRLQGQPGAGSLDFSELIAVAGGGSPSPPATGPIETATAPPLENTAAPRPQL